MDKEYNLNHKIVKLWKNIDSELKKEYNFLKRIPKFYTRPKKDSILFIGLNPAYQKDRFKGLDLKVNPDNFDGIIDNYDIAKIANFEKDSQDKNSENYYGKYFNDLNYIADNILRKKNGGINFEQCDMFLMRETDATDVKKLVEFDEGFRYRQIEILKEYFKDAKPRMIIIPNHEVSKNYYRYILNDKIKKISFPIAKNIPLIKQVWTIDQYIKDKDNAFEKTLDITNKEHLQKVRDFHQQYKSNKAYKDPIDLIEYSFNKKIPTVLWKTFQHSHISNLKREILCLQLKDILKHF